MLDMNKEPVVVLERLPENFECSQCGRRFVCKVQLTQHEVEHKAEGQSKTHVCMDGRSREVNESTSEPPKKGRFECGFCGQIFNISKSLNEHVAVKHHKLPVRLYEHSDQCLSGSSASSLKVSQVFSCVKCGRHFATHQSLKRHESRSHQRVPHLFRCTQCGRGFALEDARNFHVVTSHGGLSR